MTAEARTIPVELDAELARGLSALSVLDGMDEQDVLRRLLADHLRVRAATRLPILPCGRLLDGTETGR